MALAALALYLLTTLLLQVAALVVDPMQVFQVAAVAQVVIALLSVVLVYLYCLVLITQ
jgi:hypothetical protein